MGWSPAKLLRGLRRERLGLVPVQLLRSVFGLRAQHEEGIAPVFPGASSRICIVLLFWKEPVSVELSGSPQLLPSTT